MVSLCWRTSTSTTHHFLSQDKGKGDREGERERQATFLTGKDAAPFPFPWEKEAIEGRETSEPPFSLLSPLWQPFLHSQEREKRAGAPPLPALISLMTRGK